MPKNHIVYFENNLGLGRPKSKSYTRLRLHQGVTVTRRGGSPGSRRPKSAYHRGHDAEATASTSKQFSDDAAPTDEQSAMADTVVTSWRSPAPSPLKTGDMTPHRLVSTWLTSAVHNLTPYVSTQVLTQEPQTNVTEIAVYDTSSQSSELPVTSLSEDTWAAVAGPFYWWMEFHLKHFSEEENILMPMTQKVSPSALGRCRAVLCHLVTPALERSAGDFLYFIGWCVKKLTSHGSQQHPPEVAVRVFVRALHSTSSSSQWLRFLPTVKENCSSDIWTAMVEKYCIDLPFGDDILFGSDDNSFAGDPPLGNFHTCVSSLMFI